MMKDKNRAANQVLADIVESNNKCKIKESV